MDESMSGNMTKRRIYLTTMIVSFVLLLGYQFLETFLWLRYFDTSVIFINVLGILLVLAFCFSSYELFFESKKKRTLLFITIVVLLIIQLGLWWSLQNGKAQVTAVTSIEQNDEQLKNGNYITIPHETHGTIVLSCREPLSDKVIKDKDVLYVIEYRTISLDQRTGFLNNLELTNFVDNR